MYWFKLENEAYKERRADLVRPNWTDEQKTIAMLTPKGRRAAFQLVAVCDEPFVMAVSDAMTSHWSGQTESLRVKAYIDGFDVELRPIGFMKDDLGVDTADLLLPSESVYVPALQPQPIWIETEIPRGATAGEYNGNITMWRHKGFEPEEKVAELSFALTVADVVLPENKDNGFHLDLWQHCSNIARKHETPVWSDAHFAVLEKYVQSLAELGQKAVTVIASEYAWSGQGCYKTTEYPSDLFEYSMIGIRQKDDGDLECNFAPCDRYIDMCAKYGIKDEIEVFGLINIWTDADYGFGDIAAGGEYSDGIRVRYQKADGSFDFLRTDAQLSWYFRAIADHFIARGLIDAVRVVADEPADPELYLKRREFLQKCAPEFLYKAAVFDYHFVSTAGDKIRDFVPVFNGVCKDPEKMAEVKKTLPGRFLWYVCCSPKMPNTYISSHLVESYAVGWLTKYLGFDGFLRWSYTVWPENPRQRMSYRAPGWSAGDTCFVYPANDGSPILTLRWKALKRGIELFSLACMAEKKCGAEILDEAYGKIMKTRELRDFTKTERYADCMSTDYADYADAEKIILTALEG